jgi:Zn-dependent protease with chaperone function
MDFFEAQERARRKTGLLIFYFACAVALMFVGFYLTLIGVLHAGSERAHGGRAPLPIDWFQPTLLLAVAGVLFVIIGGGSLFKVVELRAGGSGIAGKLGGQRVRRDSPDPLEQRLLNVVEEMAIASGVSPPPVYVLGDEGGINAFAAGFTPDDAVIGVNRGTLEYLTRDELQGVIAHEFSHILNGDMRFNLRLIGLLHGILLLAVIGYYVLRFGGYGRYGRSSSGRKGSGSQVALVGLACLVLGYVGLFFGRLIKAAVSRQREYLADASAVQFTRNPHGIAGALEKIGGVPDRSDVRSPEAETASHMFFGSALRRASFNPFATHPPLVDRIRAIDPAFDGNFPEVRPVSRDRVSEEQVSKEAAAQKAGPAGVTGLALGGLLDALGVAETLPLDPVLLVAAVGAPTSEHVEFSRRLLATLPSSVAEAVREPFSARAAMFALLLCDEPRVREEQLEILSRDEGPPTREETERLAPHLEKIDQSLRLPIIGLAQASLRDLSPRQYEGFRESIKKLVEADRRISVFEFVMQRLLVTHLDRIFHHAPPPTVLHRKMSSVAHEATILLSALARVSSEEESEAAEAFAASHAALGPGSELCASMLSAEECSVQEIDRALTDLVRAAPAVKKRILCAATLGVAADGEVRVAEAELLRAIADSLDCPIPPIVAGNLGTETGDDHRPV